MRIRARHGWIGVDLRELWDFRELLYFLTWRDIKVRYKQTILGAAWAVLQPVLMMAIMTVIFGVLLGVQPDGEYPYPVFVFAALVPWTFFSVTVNLGGQSLVNQQHLMTKIYLPRLFVPAASVLSGLVELLIGFVAYGVVLAIYGQSVGAGVLALPLLILLTVMAALGFSWGLAALTVAYRDFRYVLPFMIQVMLYISPVVYPVTLVPQRYHALLAINPMTGIIDGYRSAILGKPWNVTTLTVSTVATIAVFLLGLFYFRRTERRFADIA